MTAPALYRCTVDSCGMERRSASGLKRLGTCRTCGAGFMERATPAAALLALGIRPLDAAPAPERPAEPLRLSWSVRRERVETTSADGYVTTRERWAAYVEGCRAGYYPTEAEAEEIARDLADDPEPTLADRIAELARDEATLRARGTEAALASAEWAREERERLEARLRMEGRS